MEVFSSTIDNPDGVQHDGAWLSNTRGKETNNNADIAIARCITNRDGIPTPTVHDK